jgi:FAD/FMN-containing dehydrogenase
VHGLKYGLTVHNVLSVELLTIDGEQLTLGSLAPDTPGFDLLGLLTGSEGMLGVITEVTVKLLPKPQETRALLAAFPAVGAIGPDYYCMDGTIPRKQLPHVLKRMEEMSAEYGLPVVTAATASAKR